MKYIIFTIFFLIAFFILLVIIPIVLAYDYQDNSIRLTILDNENWVITLDEITYNMDWINGRLRTAGLDGTCHWCNGEEITPCSLREYSIYLSNH